MLSVFNAIFNKGFFPTAWTLGLIVPIHKKGDHDNAENYRGISLMSCLSKLFTNILNIRLNKWAEANSSFDNFQFDFREKRSTVDAIFLLQCVVEIFLYQKNSLFVSFIDLRKAFDKTHHEALWYKLYENKISTKTICIITDLYKKMKLCVKTSFESENAHSVCRCNKNRNFNLILQPCNCFYEVNDQHNVSSCYFSPVAGVLQGESLSPFLFSIFLNDINEFLKNDPTVGVTIFDFFMLLILFADDMVLLSETKQGLQRGLNKLNDYCNDWGLSVNVEKTKCLVFKNGGKIKKTEKWYFNGEIIETVDSFKYLGFLFGSSGKFKKGIDNLEIRGEKALFDMTCSIVDFKTMHFKMKIDLFNSLVKSVLCYGCEVWGFSEAKKHETIHLKFLKQILCVRKNVPSCFVYNECKMYPLYITRTMRIINYWLKILSLNEMSPVKRIYNIALQLNKLENTRPASFWIENIKNILYKYGFGYVWENQNYVDDIIFKDQFKNTLIDCFWQNNNAEINDLSHNRLYRHLSTESFDYLEKLPNIFLRIALTRLRLGSHYFMVERGRWKKLDYIDRICFDCNEVEDEFHVIMCCKKYNDLRKKYLPECLYKRPSMYKLVSFLNSKDLKNIKSMGFFIHNVFIRYEKNELYAE